LLVPFLIDTVAVINLVVGRRQCLALAGHALIPVNMTRDFWKFDTGIL
jgi:hypothetical protein